MKDKLIQIITDYEEKLVNDYGVLKLEYNGYTLNKESLESFIIDFLLRNDNCDTGTTTSTKGSYSATTGRYRSIGDIFLLCKGEFDETVKLIDVMEAVYRIVERNELLNTSQYVYSMICHDIHKRVFWLGTCKGDSDEWLISTYRHPSETGINEFMFSSGDYYRLFNSI